MSQRVECVATATREDADAGAADGTGRMYYGWIILSVSMAGLIATSPGQTFGVSIFNEPMRKTLGLTHSQLAAAYMLGTLLAALPLTFVGTLMDRYGPRRTTMAIVILFGLACVVTSQVGGWGSLFVAFFLLRLLGPGALGFLSSNMLAFWFHRRLGTAEGLRHLGNALALGLIPITYLWLVETLGWRGAYLTLGLTIWGVILPLVSVLVYDRPEDIGQRMDGEGRSEPADASCHPAAMDYVGLTLSEAFRTRAGWIVATGTAFYGLVHTAVFFCIVPICAERGLREADAATVLSTFAVSLAIMHLVGGVLADRLSANRLLALGMAGLASSLVALLTMSAPWSAKAAGGLFGASQGLFFATSNPLWARYFGRLHIGKIRGMLATLNVGMSSIGPLLAGLSRDQFGSFTPALVAFALATIPLVFLSLLATHPAHRRSESQSGSLPTKAPQMPYCGARKV